MRINPIDEESDKIQAAGLVIKEETPYPSSWRSKQSLDDYLVSQNIVTKKSIDTRALIRHIRDRGNEWYNFLDRKRNKSFGRKN